MGSQFSAPVKLRSERATRGIVALLLVVGVLAAITITGSGIASAAVDSFNGFYYPRVVDGRIDVNGDGRISPDDDSTDFMRSTDINDGLLYCSSWTTATPNDFASGGANPGTCELQGFNSSSQKVFIYVVDGYFTFYKVGSTGTKALIPDGFLLPGVYDTEASVQSYSNANYSTADWAFRIIGGRVDYDRDGTNDTATDSKDGLAGLYDVINGYVDVDADNSTTADSGDHCDACFFGYTVTDGYVQTTGPAYPTAVGSPGPTGATGAAGKDGVSGRVSVTTTTNTNSTNKGKTTLCSGTTKVLGGGYSITGDTTVLAHLTVVANGPVSGGWRVRVIEATPTSGSWSVTVTAICADA